MASASIDTLKANVVVRASSGGGNYINPVRVYLFKTETGDPPNVFNLRRHDAVYHRENDRATRRMRKLVEHGMQLAAAYNTGKITWQQATERF